MARAQSRAFSPVGEGSIVAKAATACGFRTVRVGKRSSAQNALTANRAAALGGIGGRVIGSSRAAAADGLWLRRLPPPRVRLNAPALPSGPEPRPHLTPPWPTATR